MLKLGGHLIVEFQSWKSYKKTKGNFQKFKEVYPKIEKKPEDFDNLLIEQFGFELVKTVYPEGHDFKRDFKVFQKVKSMI